MQSSLTTFLERLIRVTLFLLLFALLQSWSSTGESQVVSLSFKDAPLPKVIAEIRKQTGYTFTYSEIDVAKAKPVTVNIVNAKLLDALSIIFRGQPLVYTVIERIIIVKEKLEKKTEVEQSAYSKMQIGIDVQGRVTNEMDEPVAGVSIVVKGNEKIGTTTNSDGEYELRRIESSAVLVFTGVNIQQEERRVNGQRNLDVRVKGKTGKLDEVQVIAYGKSSQRFNLGVVSTVSADEIGRQPVNNPLLALSGRIPGLEVQQANGISGGGITIRIQGRNNLDNRFVGSDPFIVVDGIPYSSQNLESFIGGRIQAPILGSSTDDGFGSFNRYGNPLAFLNPADIESISVLRDADATAIYGSRAANGAILITTKRGKIGEMKTDVNIQEGWGQVPRKIKLLNSQQYMEMRREAHQNDGRPIRQTEWDLRGVWDTTRQTDWQDELIGGTANFTRLTVGVSGGNKTVQYLVSSTYGRETSVFPGDFANTFGSIHFNLSISSANQRFRMQVGGTYMANSNKLPPVDYTQYALNLPPVAPPLYNQDGSLNWALDPITGNSTWYNPLWRNFDLFETKTNNLISNGSLSYRLIPGLELKSTFGFTSTTSDQFMAALDESEKPELRADRNRSATFTYNTSRTWIIEPQITWYRKWGLHTVNILIGTTLQHQRNDGRGFVAMGQSNDLLLRNMMSGTSVLPSLYDVNEYKYNAAFGRVSYNYKERYLINVSGRRDGSSRFGRESQFANFGAIGVGWLISEESFLKRNFRIISYAKIRASYGTTGNDQIGDYKFMYLFESFFPGLPYQGASGARASGLPNPYLEWEETRKLQAGVDLGLGKDLFLFSFNYYRNRTSNSLTIANMPNIAGFNSYSKNIPALIQNSGYEFTTSVNNIKIGSVRLSSNLNLTIPRNKLLAFPGLESSYLNYVVVVGQPLNSFLTYRFYGVDPQTGVYMVTNRNGEPTQTPELADLSVVINTNPTCYGGFQNNLSFKNFSIDFLLQFAHKKSADLIKLQSNPGSFNSSGRYTITGNQPEWVMERWQKSGDVSKYEKFASSAAVLATETGDLVYKDGSYIKLKNVSISYLFENSWLKSVKLRQLRLFVNGQNIIALSKYRGFDPESPTISALPPLRMITAGAQFGF